MVPQFKRNTSKSKTPTKNALVHGVYSSDIILPWESRTEFANLLEGIREELQPVGTLEDEIIFDIARLRWHVRRVQRMMQGAFTKSRFSDAIAESGNRGFSGLRRALRDGHEKEEGQAAAFSSAVVALTKELKAARKKIRGRAKSPDKLETEIEETLKKLSSSFAATANFSSDGGDILDAEYIAKLFAPACELEARLEGQITKRLKDLVLLREVKRQYCRSEVKIIEHKPVAELGVAPQPSPRAPQLSPRNSKRPRRHDENEQNDEGW